MSIEQWKLKRLIKTLDSIRGAGTSMISLVIPPNEQISLSVRLLTEEMGTVSNIKSRVNRLSVQSAITSVLHRLKQYSTVPKNGLIVYSGLYLTDDNKEKKFNLDFEPFKPINTSLYLCDNKFHTEAIKELLSDDEKYGFIIVDGNGALYGVLSGSVKTILHKFSVDLPKKHGRGGQSAQRFGRIRMEKRQHYIRKVAETATLMFIEGNMPNVSGIIIAGSAEFKYQLQQSDVFDPRLLEVVIGMVDVSYGGENGFSQAIDKSANIFKNSKFIKEKKIVSAYMNEIAKDTGKISFGIRDTMTALELGAVETLILWEDFKEMKDDDELLVDWFAMNYTKYGCNLELITDCSSEGAQFVQGFGGIGAILRYPVVFDDATEFKEDTDDALETEIDFDADFI